MALMLIAGGCSQQPAADNAASTPPAATTSLPPAAMPSLVPTEGNRPPADDLPPDADHTRVAEWLEEHQADESSISRKG